MFDFFLELLFFFYSVIVINDLFDFNKYSLSQFTVVLQNDLYIQNFRREVFYLYDDTFIPTALFLDNSLLVFAYQSNSLLLRRKLKGGKRTAELSRSEIVKKSFSNVQDVANFDVFSGFVCT